MRKHNIVFLLFILPLLVACKQSKSLVLSVCEVGQIEEDGKPVRLFSLTNRNGMTIEVTNFAATLVSVSVPDRDGNFEHVVLGFDSLTSYLGKHPKFGATVGRFANRIKNGEFYLDNQIIQLEKNSKRKLCSWWKLWIQYSDIPNRYFLCGERHSYNLFFL